MRIVCRLFKFFIPSKLEKIAKETGFMVRNSKLMVDTFVKAMTLGCLDTKNITEEVIADKCSLIQNGVSLTKQAISNRLKNSVPFFRELINIAMNELYTGILAESLSHLTDVFEDVKLLDATTISLPDKLSKEYPGMGGRNAKSALKIQTVYSAIKHSITSFNVTAGLTHDVNEWTNVTSKLTKNELVIADLGYYDFKAFEEICKSNYFLSRFKKNRNFYVIDETLKSGYKKFDLIKRLKASKGYIDEEVYIKSKDSKMMKVRLVGNKLSNRIASMRIRKNVLKNNKQNISSELKTLLHWNLVITSTRRKVKWQGNYWIISPKMADRTAI